MAIKFDRFFDMRISVFVWVLLAVFGCSPAYKFSSPMPSPPPAARGETADLFAKISSEKEKLKGHPVDPEIDGLVAFINIVKEMETQVSGQSITAAIDQENVGFKAKHKSIYQNLQRVKLIFNKGGTVYISTRDGEPLEFGDVYVENGSRAQISRQGNLTIFSQVEGIYGKAAFIKMYVETIQFNEQNGDLKAILKKGPSKTANLKKDILAG